MKKYSGIKGMKEALYRISYVISMDLFIRFYNYHKRLVSERTKEIQTKLDAGNINQSSRQKLKSEKLELEKPYRQLLVGNTFLMMYSHLEEHLALMRNMYVKQDSQSKKSGLDRFKNDFKDSVNLGDGPHWQFFKDCEKIRHALLHAGGNITLMQNNKLAGIIKKYGNKYFDCVEKKPARRLILKEKLLDDFSSASEKFIEWLLEEVK
ncbi:MAG: hypothetical protein ACNS63_00285 [Candidatus Nitrospinota bacterium M3_3B_026]